VRCGRKIDIAMRDLLATRIVVLMLALLGPPPLFSRGADAAPICDPLEKLNNQARAQRLSGHPDQAQQTVRRVLQVRPNDFRAHYTNGLAIIGNSKGKQKETNRGIAELVAAAKLLPDQDTVCAKDKNYYSILNSIGAAYYNAGNVVAAKQYFALAYANRDKLTSGSLGRVTDNLGLIALKDGDYGCASGYFQLAQKAGNPQADNHLQLTEKIFTAAKVSPSCKQIGLRAAAH